MAKTNPAFSFKKYATYYSILFILSVVILAPQIPFLYTEGILKISINLLLIQSFLLIPCILFFRKLKVYYILLSLYCSIIPVLFLPFLIVHESINPELMVSVFSSTFREVYELLGLRLLLLVLCCAVFFYAIRRLTNPFPATISFKKAIALSGISAITFFSILILFANNSSTNIVKIFKSELPQFYPFDVFINSHAVWKTYTLENNYTVNTASFSFGAHKNAVFKKRTVQVLVIGESSRYDHWYINGYSRNTSPYLTEEQHLFSFSNVAAGATLTYKSVPFLITKVGIDDFNSHLKEKSVMAAFKEAGFYTAWISNQDGSLKSNLAEFHTADADTTIYTNNTVSGEQKFLTQGLYDESVLSPLHSFLHNKKEDLFIVVHLMGNHWNYKLRYPPAFNIFVPKDTNHTKVFNNYTAEELVCAYDNSILYNDFILHAIINELKSVDACSSLLFVSDHGENLGDDGKGLYLHTATPTYYTAHVPLFIWLSDELDKEQPAIASALLSNINKPISSAESVFYTVLQLGGVTIKDSSNVKEHSLASGKFLSSEQRISGESNIIYTFKNLSEH